MQVFPRLCSSLLKVRWTLSTNYENEKQPNYIQSKIHWLSKKKRKIKLLPMSLEISHMYK